jgi:hypothetical protein
MAWIKENTNFRFKDRHQVAKETNTKVRPLRAAIG